MSDSDPRCGMFLEFKCQIADPHIDNSVHYYRVHNIRKNITDEEYYLERRR